jgi:hypothetical protein
MREQLRVPLVRRPRRLEERPRVPAVDQHGQALLAGLIEQWVELSRVHGEQSAVDAHQTKSECFRNLEPQTSSLLAGADERAGRVLGRLVRGGGEVDVAEWAQPAAALPIQRDRALQARSRRPARCVQPDPDARLSHQPEGQLGLGRSDVHVHIDLRQPREIVEARGVSARGGRVAAAAGDGERCQSDHSHPPLPPAAAAATALVHLLGIKFYHSASVRNRC